MYCNGNTSGCGIFSHHSVTLEEDKTIDVAMMNVSIDHQKKGLKADDKYSRKEKRKFSHT